MIPYDHCLTKERKFPLDVIFDKSGRYVFSTSRNYELFDTTSYVKEPIFIKTSNVTRVKPTLVVYLLLKKIFSARSCELIKKKKK